MSSFIIMRSKYPLTMGLVFILAFLSQTDDADARDSQRAPRSKFAIRKGSKLPSGVTVPGDIEPGRSRLVKVPCPQEETEGSKQSDIKTYPHHFGWDMKLLLSSLGPTEFTKERPCYKTVPDESSINSDSDGSSMSMGDRNQIGLSATNEDCDDEVFQGSSQSVPEESKPSGKEMVGGPWGWSQGKLDQAIEVKRYGPSFSKGFSGGNRGKRKRCARKGRGNKRRFASNGLYMKLLGMDNDARMGKNNKVQPEVVGRSMIQKNEMDGENAAGMMPMVLPQTPPRTPGFDSEEPIAHILPFPYTSMPASGGSRRPWTTRPVPGRGNDSPIKTGDIASDPPNKPLIRMPTWPILMPYKPVTQNKVINTNTQSKDRSSRWPRRRPKYGGGIPASWLRG